MPIPFILLPLFVEVILTFVLLFWLAPLRRNAIRGGALHPREIALGQKAWPQRTQQIGKSFDNQFQLPVLFYVLTILSMITRHADMVFLVLAWIFVLSRIAHAYVHTTSNRVLVRGGLYGIGAFALAIAWLIFIVRILAGLP
ncbi:MAG TPA: MAPEG family protein [Pseudolabrys sp.]|nr:MAPEG family protein [Pseudolabrys sp.]